MVEIHTQSPSARGGATLVKTRIRNIKTGQLVDHVFKAGERVPTPDFAIRPSQYLYDEGQETYYFMDMETYEQFPLKRADIEYELGFIRPQDEVRALVFNGHCIGIELARTVQLAVAQTDRGVKGGDPGDRARSSGAALRERGRPARDRHAGGALREARMSEALRWR